MFIVFSILGFIGFILMVFVAIYMFAEHGFWAGIVAVLVMFLLLGIGIYGQTHASVPAQYTGITRNSITQEVRGPYGSGIVPKPFFGKSYNMPASQSFERCEQFTPSIKGSYGITVDVCFYYNASAVDWVKEVNLTGSFDADYIMSTWRNSIVRDVAKTVKYYTPEQLGAESDKVETQLYDNVEPWFTERGIPLKSVSFKNWDFTSETVGQSFDESIVSQRKITEQSALFEASKISRERETFEAETAKLVAEEQMKAIKALGLKDDQIVEWLWIKLLSDQDEVPDTVILGNAGVAVPAE